jgi:hypothetical protein
MLILSSKTLKVYNSIEDIVEVKPFIVDNMSIFISDESSDESIDESIAEENEILKFGSFRNTMNSGRLTMK